MEDIFEEEFEKPRHNNDHFDGKMKITEMGKCGPRISAHAFPTRWRARFLF